VGRIGLGIDASVVALGAPAIAAAASVEAARPRTATRAAPAAVRSVDLDIRTSAPALERAARATTDARDAALGAITGVATSSAVGDVA